MPKIFDRPNEEIGKAKRINENLWFELLQPLLLKIANTDYGRDLLCIQKKPYPVVLISKKEVRYYLGRYNERDYFLSDFRVGAKWANVIRYRWPEFKAYAKRFYEKELYGQKIYLPLLKHQGMYVAGCVVDTFFPDPDPETTTVDGVVGQTQASGAWTNLVTGVGSFARDNIDVGENFPIYADTGTGADPDFETLYRGIHLYDTASIPDANTITAATISLFGKAKTSTLFAPEIAIYLSAPASNTALANGDFDSGDFNVRNATKQSDVITNANWSTTAYNVFTLNATGLGNISKTGITKFGCKETTKDDPDTAPTFATSSIARLLANTSEFTGTTQDPKLEVTHSVAAGMNLMPLLGIG